jgi:hypothetical protein
MHRSLTAALAAALGLLPGLSSPPSARAGSTPAAVQNAEARLARDDPRGAVSALEAALPGAPEADRAAVLDLLRRAYPAAARKAEGDGQHDQAESYRENLSILERTLRPSAEGPGARSRGAGRVSDPLAEVPDRSTPRPGSPAETAPVPTEEPPTPVKPTGPPSAVLVPLRPASGTRGKVAPPRLPVEAPEAEPAADPVRAADEAFVAARYNEAGRAYAALARAGSLPAECRDRWAYCRASEVVRRINARPTSSKEWAAIDAEVAAIRALSPSQWFAEYVRNLATERNREPRGRTSRSGKVVVRGSSPDEPPPPPAHPVPGLPPGPSGGTRVAWSRRSVATPNFVVRHVEEHRALAAQVARAAEAAREAQAKRWGPSFVPAGWDPRCEIVLFPTVQDFTRETMQPPDSPGFSTMGMNGGRIVLRRVHLRADHPNLVKAILPHEVTHVVLADLFPHQQIPRWADEGMAVLSEPHSEQSIRAADLEGPLKSGRLFKLSDLVVMDYPAPAHWSLYYAQSVSLTRFLVETGTPAQFVKLVQSAQQAAVVHLFGKVDTTLSPDNPKVRGQIQEACRLGFLDALREVYSISGYDDLQARWLAYARDHSAAALAASSTGAGTSPAPARR